MSNLRQYSFVETERQMPRRARKLLAIQSPKENYLVEIKKNRPFLISLLPSPFLASCAILPTSFGGKVPHLRRLLVVQLLHQTVS